MEACLHFLCEEISGFFFPFFRFYRVSQQSFYEYAFVTALLLFIQSIDIDPKMALHSSKFHSGNHLQYKVNSGENKHDFFFISL